MKREEVKEESDREVYLENENDTLLWTGGVHS
jgi:hypothetical protein